jgi:hypothetical protein
LWVREPDSERIEVFQISPKRDALARRGKAVVMDAAHGGTVLAAASAGSGVDIIDYDPVRRHLYVPGGRSATITIFSVGANGALTQLATTPTARGAHCVATDGKDVYVCDPDRGRILVVRDSFPAAKP